MSIHVLMQQDPSVPIENRALFRFLESPLPLSRMHWDLEPMAIPLTRPTDTLSPTGGEGQCEGVRFIESLDQAGRKIDPRIARIHANEFCSGSIRGDSRNSRKRVSSPLNFQLS